VLLRSLTTSIKQHPRWSSIRLREPLEKNTGDLQSIYGVSPPQSVTSVVLEPLKHPSFSFESARDQPVPEDATEEKRNPDKPRDFYTEAIRASPPVEGRARSASSSYPSVGLRTPEGNASPLPTFNRLSFSKLTRFNISEVDFSCLDSATSLPKPTRRDKLGNLDEIEGLIVPTNTPQTESVADSRDQSLCPTPADRGSLMNLDVSAGMTTAVDGTPSLGREDGGSPVSKSLSETSGLTSLKELVNSAKSAHGLNIQCPPRKSSLGNCQLINSVSQVPDTTPKEISKSSQKVTLRSRIGRCVCHIEVKKWIVKRFRRLCGGKPRTGPRRKLQKKRRPATTSKGRRARFRRRLGTRAFIRLP